MPCFPAKIDVKWLLGVVHGAPGLLSHPLGAAELPGASLSMAEGDPRASRHHDPGGEFAQGVSIGRGAPVLLLKALRRGGDPPGGP